MPNISRPNRRGTAACAAFAEGLAAVLALLLAAPLPAQAVPLRLDWTLSFSYPPNPCIDGRSLVSHSLGLFVAARNDGGYAALTSDPSPEDLGCGASDSGTTGFDADDGTAIFGAYSAAMTIPGSDLSGQPVYAFLPGTAAVGSDPGAAPFVALGTVCGNAFCSSSWPSELPLFAFASPGTPVGMLSLDITAAPEPATWSLLLLAGGAAWAAGRRRPRARRPAT
jgi:hypothetical protein